VESPAGHTWSRMLRFFSIMQGGEPYWFAFLLVRPAGRTHLGVKVSYRPDRGNC
jgi:hypothetical protein